MFCMAMLFSRNRKSKVFYYHDMGTAHTDMGTDISLFLKHLSVFEKEGFAVVEQITEPENQVMICFDDGWRGLYENREVLLSRGIHPTVFIAVDLIGEKGYLTESQIRELHSLGFVFQSHSWSHSDLTEFSGDALDKELSGAKKHLEQQFGWSFDSICYPMGRHSDKVCQGCLKAGYKLQYTSISGGYYDMMGKKQVCRNCAQYSSPKELRMMLLSTSRLFRRHLRALHYVKA